MVAQTPVDEGSAHGSPTVASADNQSRSDGTEFPASLWDTRHGKAVVRSPMTTCLRLERKWTPKARRELLGRATRSLSLGEEVEFDSELTKLTLPYLGTGDKDPKRNKKAKDPSAKSSVVQSSENDDKQGHSTLTLILYGVINGTIVLPVLMSFAAIIYRSDAFRPYMPILTKLTLCSGVVHQLCFSYFSSLPFAVGSVQDAGLIFLSLITANIVEYCRAHGLPDDVLLATTTVGLSICTAMLGLALIAVGKLKLAQYVQMLPTCVVGGYLAAIGWFCGISGVGLMAKENLSWSTLTDASEWLHILPGVLSGIGIYSSLRRFQHVAVLPTCIIILISIFYLVLWLTGSTVEEVADTGWIRHTDSPPAWYSTWNYFQFSKVQWHALPKLALTELSMMAVVALSSSLDVAAIELELKRPLDFNHELTTVGVSNVISGLTGGYTGSYIFSQSIFCLRAGIQSRIAGFVLAFTQILFLVLPFDILSFVPLFFFGALLTMISVDLMVEWLWEVRLKLTAVEYVICLSTFGFIQLIHVEYGILAGVALYIACYKLGLDVGPPKHASLIHEDSNGSEELERPPAYGAVLHY